MLIIHYIPNVELCTVNINTKLCIIQFQLPRGLWSNKWTVIHSGLNLCHKRRHKGPLGVGASVQLGLHGPGMGQHQKRIHFLASCCPALIFFGICSDVFSASCILSNSSCLLVPRSLQIPGVSWMTLHPFPRGSLLSLLSLHQFWLATWASLSVGDSQVGCPRNWNQWNNPLIGLDVV